MKKLWKVTVNQWGCDRPKTLYAESREDAEKIAEEYPASDPVEYAGRFNDLKAEFLLGHIDQFEYREKIYDRPDLQKPWLILRRDHLN